MKNEEWKDEFFRSLFSTASSKVKIDEAMELKYKHIPTSLFKYRRFDTKKHNINNLKNDELWFSISKDFNDPYDCLLTIRHNEIRDYFIKNSLERIYKKNNFENFLWASDIENIKNSKNPFNEFTNCLLRKFKSSGDYDENKIHTIKSVFDKLMEEINEISENSFEKIQRTSMLISCLSQVKDSLLMWSHYADSHKGFCIEYDFSRLCSDNELMRGLMPVNYLYSDKLFDATEYLLPSYDGKEINSLYTIYAAISKFSEWNYEKEWRIVLPAGIDCESRSYEVPTPKAVYLGAKIDKNNEESIRQITKSKGIALYKMDLDKYYFKLKPQLIS